MNELKPHEWMGEALRISINAALHAGHSFYSKQHTCFLSLALAGEVGELCNVIKKYWRDGKLTNYEEELADVYIYLGLLAENLGVDLDYQARRKLVEVAKRNFAKPVAKT